MYLLMIIKRHGIGVLLRIQPHRFWALNQLSPNETQLNNTEYGKKLAVLICAVTTDVELSLCGIVFGNDKWEFGNPRKHNSMEKLHLWGVQRITMLDVERILMTAGTSRNGIHSDWVSGCFAGPWHRKQAAYQGKLHIACSQWQQH